VKLFIVESLGVLLVNAGLCAVYMSAFGGHYVS